MSQSSFICLPQLLESEQHLLLAPLLLCSLTPALFLGSLIALTQRSCLEKWVEHRYLQRTISVLEQCQT